MCWTARNFDPESHLGYHTGSSLRQLILVCNPPTPLKEELLVFYSMLNRLHGPIPAHLQLSDLIPDMMFHKCRWVLRCQMEEGIH